MNLTSIPKEVSNKVKDCLKDNKKRIAILTHVNPDGDAIGSALGLYGFLKLKGFQNVSVIVPNEYASFLHWMPYNEDVIIADKNLKTAGNLIFEAEIIFCLDFNQPDRIDHLSNYLINSKAVKILVDHHPQPDHKHFDIVLSDTEMSSTAELIFILINSIENNINFIDKKVAACLYAGIVTDTGSFSYSNRNPQTYIIVAALIEKGINPVEIQSNIYDTYSESRMRLLGYCLKDKLTILPNKKVAYISLTSEELRMFSHKEGDTEGIVNYALSVEGIDLAAFFMERDGIIKISLRSKRLIDVNKIARLHFNGGGHMNASGGKLELSMKEAIEMFEKLFSNENFLINAQ
jgi:bifunctional oligoribonuclease and PAP phosphatase NrnA